MEDQMGDWTSIELLYWGHSAPLVWTHTEDWVAIVPRHMHPLTLLASHLGSGNVRGSPSWTGPLHIIYDGVITVIQELNGVLCTSLLGPDTPALLAVHSS